MIRPVLSRRSPEPCPERSRRGSEGEGDERGVTLTELLVALAIAGLITGTLVAAIYQIYQVTGWGSNELRVQHDLENAATWLLRDVQMADPTLTDASGSTLNLIWNDMYRDRNATYQVSYQVSGTNLVRTVAMDYVPVSTLAVSRYIAHPSHVVFSLSGTADISPTLTAVITSTAGQVVKSATLRIEMRPRPVPE